MSSQHPLQGACSCGRNRYTVQIPRDATERATVFFDNGAAHRRSQASPLSAWLRIPLSWYNSTTYAFFDDESHSSIRRSYTSPHQPDAKRHFCGFCGTPLSYWSESPPSEADYISLTLGSLNGSVLRDLEDLGVLPKEALEDAEIEKAAIESAVTSANSTATEGLPWFEKMVEGSKLGKMRHSSGQRQSGRYKVEWEIVEWTDDVDGNASPAKRKIDEVEEPDSRMEGAH